MQIQKSIYMRKNIIATVGIFMLSLAFTKSFSQDDKDNEKNKIIGSGNVITRNIAIRPFDQLEASGVFNVSLTQGSVESVKIEAEDNLQDLFEVKNDGSKLIVGMKKDSHFDSKKKMTVYISFKNLKSMDLKMVGNLTNEGNLNFNDLSLDNKSVGSVDLSLNAQKLAINNKSVGSLKLSGKVENAVIRSNGVGSIKAGSMVAQTVDIDNDGVGNAEVNAVKVLKVKDSFLGKVRNVSTAKRINKVVI
jgi:Putative auto-transporter adhesin, head GIN domain